MLLLLDLVDRTILECPLDNIGLVAGTGDDLGLFEGGPELAEILKLYEVPYVREGSLDDDALEN